MTQPDLLRLDSLFDVMKGHQLALANLHIVADGQGVAYVARSHRNNGVTAWVDLIPGVEPAAAGTISVCLRSRNHSLAAFVQPQPFYTAYHMAVLTPRKPMTIQERLWFCRCIEANRFRFNFGRQANRTIGSILLPARAPDWVHQVSLASGRATEKMPEMELPRVIDWAEFSLGALFELRVGRYATRRDLRPGKTPFVTASDVNNGITAWVDLPADWPGGLLTVANNGSIGAAFYQPRPFSASRDVTIFLPKFEMTPATGMFVSTVIRHEAFRWNYARKWTAAKMRQSSIRLPASGESPAWGEIEAFMMSRRLSWALRDRA